LLRSADADVERYLKIFTFVPDSDISIVMNEHNADPGQRRAQHLLASEVLEMIHGQEEAEKTRAEHQLMRNPSLASLSNQKNNSSSEGTSGQDINRISLPKSQVLNTPIAHILYHAALVKSKSEGTRMIDKGGVYIAANDGSAELNFVKIKDQTAGDVASLLVDNLLIFRLGKWKIRVIEVVEGSKLDQKRTNVPNAVE
jgi:tyrosyl-tRNA synthetase